MHNQIAEHLKKKLQLEISNDKVMDALIDTLILYGVKQIVQACLNWNREHHESR